MAVVQRDLFWFVAGVVSLALMSSLTAAFFFTLPVSSRCKVVAYIVGTAVAVVTLTSVCIWALGPKKKAQRDVLMQRANC
eukprot:symbB.v1.2.028703.t1/scaffold3068.1/size68108/9